MSIMLGFRTVRDRLKAESCLLSVLKVGVLCHTDSAALSNVFFPQKQCVNTKTEKPNQIHALSEKKYTEFPDVKYAAKMSRYDQ